MIIGLPCVLRYGSAELRARVVPEVLWGRKSICLAITEPFAGSDVAGLRCEAKKSPCGKFWYRDHADRPDHLEFLWTLILATTS